MDTGKVWAKRIEEWRKSGLTSVDFAKGKGFTAGGLRHMAFRLRRDAAKPGAIRLARVVRVRAPVEIPGAAIVVVVKDARVEVGRGASREVLSMVLDTLATRSDR